MTDEPQILGTLPPLHPGEMLREEFLVPLGLSAGRVARACGLPRTRIERIAAEKVGISSDTALRLGRFFGTTPEFWMNLQKRYELAMAEMSAAATLDSIERFKPEVAETSPERSDPMDRPGSARA